MSKKFKCHPAVVGVHMGVGTDKGELTGDACRDLLNYADVLIHWNTIPQVRRAWCKKIKELEEEI